VNSIENSTFGEWLELELEGDHAATNINTT
jgi:hypothetical protein